MSKAAAREATAEDARELDTIAGELYALQPDAFAAARDEQVRTARAAGRQPLARELSRLRRPSQSAWLINLLWREQRGVVQQFLQLGDQLSRAQAEASGPELHRLTALRRELEAALIRTARGLAQTAGVNVSASMEREAQETLSAALARPEVADEVRTGRLVKPATYAGFGTRMPASPHAPEAAPRPAPGPAPAAVPAPKPGAGEAEHQIDDREARAAQRAREQHERAVQEARAVLEAAAEALTRATRAAEAAHAQHTTLRGQVEQLGQQLQELQDRLHGLQQEAAAAGHAAVAAAQRQEQAQTSQQAALRALTRLKELAPWSP